MKRLAVLLSLVAAVATLPHGADAQIPAVPVVDGVPLCGAEGTGSPVALRRGHALRVASFNVLHSETAEGDESLEARLPLEADAIAASGAHVVGMQEVTSNTAHGNVAQRLAAALATRTGNRWSWCWFMSNPHVPGTPDVQPGGGNPLDDLAASFANFPDPGDFREGLAIVTRLTIEEARSHRLLPRSYETPLCVPPDPLGCNLPALFDSRQVLWARLDTGARDVDMFTTHIAHGLTAASDLTKLLQVKQVLTWIDLWSDPATPDVLTGDFNSAPGTDRVRAVRRAGFTDTWAAANPGADGFTGGPPNGEEVYTATPSRAMSERIDYVFSRGCRTRASQVIGDTPQLQPDGRWLWPSDHLGLTSTLACR